MAGRRGYAEWVHENLKSDPNFAEVVSTLKSLEEDGRALVVSHHDVDGVACSATLKRALEEVGVQVSCLFPKGFKVDVEEVGRQIGGGRLDVIIVSDRGTFRDYDGLKEYADEVVVIDHHPADGIPERCVWYNPSAFEDVPTAAALLCHMAVTALGLNDEYVDFYAALGGRGDFTFDPVTGRCDEFSKPFFEHVRERFPNLFRPFEGRPTRYDVDDRGRTTLINQIAEAVNALCFAHSYSERSDVVRDVYGPNVALEALLEMPSRGVSVRALSSLEEWIDSTPNPKLVREVLRHYFSDWEESMRYMENMMRLRVVGDVAVYVVFGRGVPLMPLTAAVKMRELMRAHGDREALMFAVNEKHGEVHVSARGTWRGIHCGRLMKTLSRRLSAKYDVREGVSGGGHSMAGECHVEPGRVRYERVLEELTNMLDEMEYVDSAWRRGFLGPSVRKMAEELGMTYVLSG